MEGWIKLHRQLIEWEWHDDPLTLSLFIHLLLLANHSETKWRGEVIYPGQILTGRNQLSKITKISSQSIRTCLSRLKSTSEITIKSTNKFSIITIIKWEQYQSIEKKSTNKSTSKLTNNQPATNQQLTTSKNVKNDNNDKNVILTTSKDVGDPINQLFKIFYDSINPAINYANKSSRDAASWLIEKYGIEKALSTASYACSIHGKEFAPVITTPYQLKEKLSALKGYYEREKNKQSNNLIGTL